MGERFAQAVKRFYTTEEARQAKLHRHAAETAGLFGALKSGIDSLYQQDIMFAVFELMPDADPPVMHVGMESCCGNSVIVTEQHRMEMETLITTQTKYKKVIWEA